MTKRYRKKQMGMNHAGWLGLWVEGESPSAMCVLSPRQVEELVAFVLETCYISKLKLKNRYPDPDK